MAFDGFEWILKKAKFKLANFDGFGSFFFDGFGISDGDFGTDPDLALRC
jgi:hypothetical protein